MLTLTIWMNMPSFYQDDLFQTLVERQDVDLQVIFARPLSHERQALGWSASQDRYPSRFLDSRHPILHALKLAWSSRSRVHLIGGIWAEPPFIAVISLLGLIRARFAIYAELPDPEKSRSFVKKFFQTVFGNLVAKYAIGLLAVSHLASKCYHALGFQENKIYSFGYFRSHPNLDISTSESSHLQELIFVGQLIHRKRVDLLLAAVQPLFEDYPNLRLTIIGDGAERFALEELVREQNNTTHITFTGVLSSDCIYERLRSAIALILPSRYDGWGVVVNEALSVGVSVIISDQCGAADVIHSGINGYRFPSGDVVGLRNAIETLLSLSEKMQIQMRNAALQTGLTLATDVVVPYLVDCLYHMISSSTSEHPVPPWENTNF